MMIKEQTKQQSIEKRFIIRPPQMSDLDDVLEMLEISDLTMVGEIENSAESLKTDWTHPKISIERNLRLVTTQEGRIIGYAEVWDNNDPLSSIGYWARVHPEFEGQGIGSYLLNWAEALSRKSMTKAPEGTRVALDAGSVSTYQPAIDLFKDHNMKLKRHFFRMRIELDGVIDEPELPENIVIRPMQDSAEVVDIVKAIDDAFQDHWGYVEGSFDNELAFWQHTVEADPTFDPTLWFLAMDGDEIIGFSLCKPTFGGDEKMGWVSELGVRPPWRRQGIALALLNHSFVELQRRGNKQVSLAVDANSITGATRLYEKAGMTVVRRFDVYEIELRPGINLARQNP